MATRTKTPTNGSPISYKPARAPRKGNGSAATGPYDAEAVAKRAYQLYLNRGGGHGSDLEDWLEAERQVKEGSTEVMARVSPKPRKRKTSEGTGP